ncbi:hypothetical protein MKW94_027860 [Papaver nudicaule]|uniref:Water stress and hypersensitive response domain-containing protein n=1 Tax=Papaver nudicaule TaxID=74823 RepID=A0AA41UYQ0_PAPNU|nr:hypothetical protein [Papaver nudicaule]
MAQFLEKAKHFVTEKVTQMKKPEATITNVDVKTFNLNSVTLVAKVSITNPFSVPIPIGEVAYTLKSLEKVIATGKMPDPGSIKANGITLLEVVVKVPYNILKSVARDVGSDWDVDYELLLGIIVDLPIIGDVTIPVSQKGELKLPTITDFLRGGGSKLEVPKNINALKNWF